MIKKSVFFVTVLFLISFFYGCTSDGEKQNKAELPQIPISVKAVVRMDMNDTVSVFGALHLRREAKIASQFDGRLEDFNLLPGDAVQKGQRLGTIIPPAREALLQTLDALPPQSRKDVEKQIKAIPLFSPISGTVNEVSCHTGDVVQKGDQIVHIGNLRTLDVRGEFPVRYLPSVKKVKKIIVSFVDYPHTPVFLPVEAVSGKVSKNSQTAMVRLKLDNPKKEFYPGMAVKLSFVNKIHKNTLVIPREALLEKEGIYSVFVLLGSKVEKRIIQPGIMQKKYIEVLSGVKEGEQAAVERAYSLTDGMEVIVK